MAALKLSSRFLFERVLLVSNFQRRGPLDAAVDGNHIYASRLERQMHKRLGACTRDSIYLKVVYVMIEIAVQMLL